MADKPSWLTLVAFAVVLTIATGAFSTTSMSLVSAQGAYLPPYSIYGTPALPSGVAVLNNTAELWGPYIGTVYYTWFTTSEAILEALVTGYIQFDEAGVSNQQEYDQLLSYVKSGEVAINITPSNSFSYAGFNLRIYPFNNYHFRLAIQDLVNYQQVASVLLNGILGIASPYYFFPQVYGSYFSSSEAQVYQEYGTFNVTRAAQELAEAGFVDHLAQGYWTYPNGSQVQPISIDVPTGPGYHLALQLMNIIVGNAKAINLSLYTVAVDFNTFIDDLEPSGNYQMYTLGWVLGSPPNPTWLYGLFGDVPLNTVYSDNYSDPHAWALLNTLEFDSPTPQAAYNNAVAAATYLQEQVPEVILDWGSNLLPVNVANWKGYTSEAPYGILFPPPYEIHPVNSTFGSLYRFGMPSPPDTLNVYEASSVYDFEVLGNEYTLPLQVSPSNPFQIIPDAAYNYTVSTGSGMTPNGHPYNGTVVTMDFLPNIAWQDGVPMTALDYNFTLWWFDLGGYSSNPYNSSSDVVTIDPGVTVNYTAEANNPSFDYFGLAPSLVDTYVPPSNPYQLTIYFNTSSVFNLLNVYGVPIMPEHVLGSVQPSTYASETAPQYLRQAVWSGPYLFSAWSVSENYVDLNYFQSYFLSNPLSNQIISAQGQLATFTMQALVWNSSNFVSNSNGYFGGYSAVNGASGTVYVLNNDTLQTVASYPLQFTGNGTYQAQISTSGLPQGSYTLVAQLNWTGTPYSYFGGGQTTSNKYELHRYATLVVTSATPTQTSTTKSLISTTSSLSIPSGATVPTTKTSGIGGPLIFVLVLVIVAVVLLAVGITRRARPAT
jgi:ABC-type oligopeptide transport system substrate-binding subunit